jgi:lipopolysaccharide biosynthesis regulator YciM
MHQNLIERDDLKQESEAAGAGRTRAGLSEGRAARPGRGGLRQAAQLGELAEDAKRNLLEIYQLEKDWEKAIVIASELPDFASHKEIAEYHCELAAAEMIRSRRRSRGGHLQTALERNRKCVRASLLQGDIALQQEQPIAAIDSPGSGSSSRIRLISRWSRNACSTRSASSIGVRKGCSLLRGYLERYPSLDLLDVVFQLVLESDGPEAAYRSFVTS